MADQVQNLITVMTSTPLRLWTGKQDLVYQGQTYLGAGNVLSVGEIELGLQQPDRRLSITLSGIPSGRRSQFLQDLGPLPVIVKWIRSSDLGQNWTEVSSFTGRLSNPIMQDGSIQVEIETERGDIDHGSVVRWSHEDQQRRYPGDLGMEHLRALSQQGIDTTWPP